MFESVLARRLDLQRKEEGINMCEGDVESDLPKKYRYFTREEVSKRCEKGEKWLIINEKVYNITNWCRKHPGGAKLISHFAGQDATVKHLLFLLTNANNNPHLNLLKT